jgi:hypothetical protein
MSLVSVSAAGPIPAIPSVIVTVQQVMNTQLGPTGPAGGPIGPTGAPGTPGTSTGLLLYLNQSQTPSPTISTYKLLSLIQTVAAQQTVNTTVNGIISDVPVNTFANYLSDLNNPLFIPPGIWDLNIFASLNTSNGVFIKFQLFGRDGGGVETQLGGTSSSVAITSTLSAQYSASLDLPYIDLTPYTSLVVKVLADNPSNTNRTLTTYYESSSSYSHIHSSFGVLGNTGPTGLQGMTGPTGPTGASQWNNTDYIGATGPGYTGVGYTGDVMVFGKLYVKDGIDPTYLALEPLSSNPIPSGLHGIWMDSSGNALRSENIYMNVNTDPASISLKPNNNQGQISLSNGVNSTNNLAYDNIKLSSTAGPITETTDYKVDRISYTDNAFPSSTGYTISTGTPGVSGGPLNLNPSTALLVTTGTFTQITSTAMTFTVTGNIANNVGTTYNINQTGTGGLTIPAVKITNSNAGPTGPIIVQYHNSTSPTGGDAASNYVTNANVILPSGTLAERMYSNIRTVLTNGSTGPTGPSANIAFDLANSSATGVTGGMATIMTISGRDPTPYPAWSASSLSESQGVQIVTTDNTASLSRRDIAGLRVQNINNNGNAAVIQTVKQRNANVGSSVAQTGDVIGAWSSWSTTSGGSYREYTRIRTQITNASSGAGIGTDGAVVIAVAENDNTGQIPLKDMFRCDGGYPLTLPGGPTGPYNLSYATMVFNPTGASGPQDITGIKAIGNASFNYGATGQYLTSNGPNSTFTWGTLSGATGPTGQQNLAQTLAIGNNAGATGIDMNQRTISNVPTITSSTNINLNPSTSVVVNGDITLPLSTDTISIGDPPNAGSDGIIITRNGIDTFNTDLTGDGSRIQIRNDVPNIVNSITQSYFVDGVAGSITNTSTCSKTKQAIEIVDTRDANNKFIKLINTGTDENRIDLSKSDTAGNISQAGIINNITTRQELFTKYSTSTGQKVISIFTEPSANSFINFTNQADAFGFTIAADTDMSIATNKVGGIVDIQAPQLLLQGSSSTSITSTGDINLTGSTLTFNTINIIPRSGYNTPSFSVTGTPPTTNILNFGAPIDMTATTIWKVEVGFYTSAINNRNILTYLAYDTTSTDCVTSSVFGYANGGLQTAIQYDPAGTPMGTYCSFVDTFQISNFAVGACSFVLAGGTTDGSTWSGTARISIILTRLQ